MFVSGVTYTLVENYDIEATVSVTGSGGYIGHRRGSMISGDRVGPSQGTFTLVKNEP